MTPLVNTLHTNLTGCSYHEYLMNKGIEIISIEISEGGVWVSFRVPSSAMHLTYPPKPAPDRVWREEYIIAVNELGVPVLKLDRVVEGKHIPASQVAEQVVWPEDEVRADVPSSPEAPLGTINACHGDGSVTAS
jgi:hypothetical protein